ncbi:hypothetical protein D8674_000239 [Pyrus ussuriensis x Pyrus communis]|uniref:Uncharacterized protein n=1 Tax=Pyrus ussuriensis x Pyrus communis TaxID=2448454 RepID=A0A5N5F2K6_9ROSA|nr:hypothetical protein D8674_000239 [Pyrus ussuriensis x Pyrus communis]
MIQSIKLQNQRPIIFANSRSINEWHEKCLKKEYTLVPLQQQLNEALCKLAKYKHLIHSQKHKFEALVEKENEDVRRRSIYSWQMKHLQEECDSAFYDGFDKFHSQLIGDGSEYTEHKYMKAAHNTPKDA